MDNFSSKIASEIQKQVAFQEHPANREVTKVDFVKNNDGTTTVTVTSNCDGWAEDENKILFTTSREFEESEKDFMIGRNELDIFTIYYGNDFNELIRSLEKLYNSSEITTECEDGFTYFDTNEDNLAKYCEWLCNGELITNAGQCNWDAHRKLAAKGYRVFAGEKDSFGWLTGCVRKEGDNRILVYG